MESSFTIALDLQDGISHPAAKPERMESSFTIALDLQDGISHPAAKPEIAAFKFSRCLISSHIRRQSRCRWSQVSGWSPDSSK